MLLMMFEVFRLVCDIAKGGTNAIVVVMLNSIIDIPINNINNIPMLGHKKCRLEDKHAQEGEKCFIFLKLNNISPVQFIIAN